MQLSIIGTGYVGLVTGACFAEMGHSVMCLDIDEKKIAKLKKGSVPFFEPGLQELVERNMKHRLHFTCDVKEAVRFGQVFFIAVPTPSLADGSCDISYVEAAVKQIAHYTEKDIILVNKSTVPVGTAAHVKTLFREEMQKQDKNFSIDVVSNPEFLKEGAAVQDCLKPDRVIIGADSAKAFQTMRDIYAPFTINHERILMMDILSSEMTKYAANAMLATRISFMNEMADICKKVGADINEVRKGIGSDSRIGYSFLYAGIGYGGSCFPKDIRALIAKAKEVDASSLLLEAVDKVNIEQKKKLSRKMISYFSKKGGLHGKIVAVWGLSFKPDTDDMREAPSLTFIEDLIQQGAILRLFDPVAMPNAKRYFKNHPNIIWCESEFEAANGAFAIALLTEWKQFRLVDFQPILSKMKGSAFFDGRNQYKPLEMKNKGFDYICIGVPDHE